MRRVLLYIAASLDGKIARKDDSLDWLPPIDHTGEDYGYKELMDSIDTVVMGYSTYDISVGLGEWGFKGMNSYVFTRDNTKPHIPDVELVTEDPVAFVRNLKAMEGKDIWLIGGGQSSGNCTMLG